jgi:hypothetical protein
VDKVKGKQKIVRVCESNVGVSVEQIRFVGRTGFERELVVAAPLRLDDG